MPSLQALAQQHGPDLQALVVNFKETAPAVQRFVQQSGLQLPVILDAQGVMTRH